MEKYTDINTVPSVVLADIRTFAVKRGISKVILFGSRARGTNSPKSDIDIAVSGGEIVDFYYDLEEKAHTLLHFDVVNIDNGISAELNDEINKDGVILYEKI